MDVRGTTVKKILLSLAVIFALPFFAHAQSGGGFPSRPNFQHVSISTLDNTQPLIVNEPGAGTLGYYAAYQINSQLIGAIGSGNIIGGNCALNDFCVSSNHTGNNLELITPIPGHVKINGAIVPLMASGLIGGAGVCTLTAGTNMTCASHTATGRYVVSISGAGFTGTPQCVANVVTNASGVTTGVASTNPTSNTSLQIEVDASSTLGGAAADFTAGSINVVCVGT
jgi:hypothetical protein